MQPSNSRRAHYDFDLSRGFLHQHGRLNCALPTTNDSDSASAEPSEIGIVVRMRNQRVWRALKCGRAMGETSDPGCHRYSLGAKRLAIFSDHTKSVLLGDNPR
jgi:hypothetical protein